MPSPRITIRLSSVLAAKLAAKAGPRGHVADIVRQAIEAYLESEPAARQPELPTMAAMADTAASLADMVAAIHGRLEALEQRLTTLEDASATGSQQQPARRKLTPRQQRALRDKYQRGVSVPALMDEYGISRASVFRYLQSPQR